MHNQENFYISFELEFYSKKNETSILSDVSSITNKKIIFLSKVQEFELKLEKIDGKYRIISCFLSYFEIKKILNAIFDWIQKNGKTSWDCDFCFNIKIGTSISKLNPLKVLLCYPEEKIYSLYPERKEYPHSKSIKNIYLTTIYSGEIPHLSNDNFIFPFRQYYGIDFSFLHFGFLKFRYVGGIKYHEDIKKCISVIDISLECIKHCMSNDLTLNEKKQLNSILKDNKNIINSYSSVDIFKKNFPDITLTVDLSTNLQIINSFYPNIKNNLFKLLSETRITKGYINYDSDKGKIQIKDAHVHEAYLFDNIDIFDSNISGNICNCDLFNTQIKNSDVFKSNLFNDSKAVNSFFNQSYLNNNSTLKNCSISGNDTIISGIVENGKINSGKIVSRLAKISDSTKIISFEKII